MADTTGAPSTSTVLFLLLVWSIGLAGCAARSAPEPPRAARAAPPPAASAAPAELPALSSHQQEIAAELRRHVEELSVKIGERNLAKEWNLASATDYLTTVLEEYGYEDNEHGIDPSYVTELHRLGFTVNDSVVQNVEATVRGSAADAGDIVVGAHFDTHRGTPGADDNASGVAAALVLARMFQDDHPQRTIRFVFFANEEQPYFQTEQMGSLVYARALIARKTRVVAMISLESIGYYSTEPGSQRYPDPLAERYPTVGDFAAVVGNPASRELVEGFGKRLREASAVPVVFDALPEDIPGVGWSDHWAFWRVGFPAVMVTDTAPFRNPHYHRASDLPEHLDFERMAHLVSGLYTAVHALTIVGVPMTEPSGR